MILSTPGPHYPPTPAKSLWDMARAAEIEAHMAKAKHFEDKANACYLTGHLGRQRYYLRRKDHFTAKAVGVKIKGAL